MLANLHVLHDVEGRPKHAVILAETKDFGHRHGGIGERSKDAVLSVYSMR